MPNYPRLSSDDIDWSVIQGRVDAMTMLGVPYGADAIANAPAMAKLQAQQLAAKLKTEGGPAALEQKEIIALIAYLQRLGMDIKLAKLAEDPAYPVISAVSACDASATSADMTSTLRAYLDGAELTSEPSGPEPVLDTALAKRGAELFSTHCATCHGQTGDGTGPTASQLVHPPANFTAGIYELRTTEHEGLPADIDMFRTISRGVHGTAMPAWFALPERDRWALAMHLKTLSKAFKDDEAGTAFDFATVPTTTPERIESGKKTYETGGCASCHGATGRGDGVAAPMLKYKNGAAAKPRDFTIGRFHRSARLSDVVMTLVTGLDGTPMASFAKVLSQDDLWNVAMFVQSLEPKFTDRNGLRCPDRSEPSADELVGVRTLMQSLHLGH